MAHASSRRGRDDVFPGGVRRRAADGRAMPQRSSCREIFIAGSCGDRVAIPAGRRHGRVVVAAVAELGFGGVAFAEAGGGQAQVVDAARRRWCNRGRPARTTLSRQSSSSVMWDVFMNSMGATQCFSRTGSTGSGPLAVTCAREIVPDGQGQEPRKSSQPRPDETAITHGPPPFPPSGSPRRSVVALLLPSHDQRVADQLVDAGDLHARHPVFEQRRQRGLVDGADAGQQVHAVLLVHVPDGVGARQAAAQAHLDILVGAQAGAAAAAEGLLADGVLGHLVEMVADACGGCSAAPRAGPWRGPDCRSRGR